MTLFPAHSHWILAICLFCMTFFCCLGKDNADVSQEGSAAVYYDIPEKVTDEEGSRSTGDTAGDDPAQVVAKALLCFNDKHIYKSCGESCRLSESGELNVKTEDTELFCTGPCLSETHMVLKCIEGIMSNFEFFNNATIKDIQDTIHAGCGYGPERGHFNVAEDVESGSSAAALLPLGIGGAMFLGFAWTNLVM